jgi:hypothetical protein
MKAASFTTEHHNSRQNMLRIYLVDNRSEVCLNLFWEYINGICFKCVIAYFFIGFPWQKWLEYFFGVIEADFCRCFTVKKTQNNLLWGFSGGLLKGCLESKRNFMEIGKNVCAVGICMA